MTKKKLSNKSDDRECPNCRSYDLAGDECRCTPKQKQEASKFLEKERRKGLRSIGEYFYHN